MNRAEAAQAEPDRAKTTSAHGAAELWRSIRGLILWSHERGSVQYDVMVTLILLFVFFSPRLINFNDRPIERNPHDTGVMVYPDGNGGLIYEVDAKAIQAGDGTAVRQQLLRVIEPISGEISISKYEPVRDKKGKTLAYRVWVDRE